MGKTAAKGTTFKFGTQSVGSLSSIGGVAASADTIDVTTLDNADGYKVPDRSALPWEKNTFKGAFELKSANGAFGIRIEVQQGKNPYYP